VEGVNRKRLGLPRKRKRPSGPTNRRSPARPAKPNRLSKPSPLQLSRPAQQSLTQHRSPSRPRARTAHSRVPAHTMSSRTPSLTPRPRLSSLFSPSFLFVSPPLLRRRAAAPASWKRTRGHRGQSSHPAPQHKREGAWMDATGAIHATPFPSRRFKLPPE
jgi:hypothetical protein